MGPNVQFAHFFVVKLKSKNFQALYIRAKARGPNSKIFNNSLFFILFSIVFITNSLKYTENIVSV